MRPEVVDALLALNRAFYATVAADFDVTRQSVPGGMLQVLASAPAVNPLHVLDVGCGNGRLLQALARAIPPEQAIAYWGVEADAGLLAIAQAACAASIRCAARALPGDILLADFGLADGALPDRFEVVACFAVLHHIPSAPLRVQALRNLAGRLAPNGRLLLSTWQFLQSERLRSRIAPWKAIGLRDADVERGDALLPWDQGAHALRYAHAITLEELTAIATAAGLTIESTFFADGHEGNLNLYAALARKEQAPP